MTRHVLKTLLGLALVLLVSACAAQTPIAPPTPPPSPVFPPPGSALQHPLPKNLKDVTDTQIFRFQVDPAQTTVEYAVNEVLVGTPQITRGRTNSVEGEFRLFMQNGKAYVALSNLQVDLRTLTTDSAVRDAAIRKNWLESDKYPKAIFVANAINGVPLDAVQNTPYKFKVTGDMTIHNTTKPVTFDVTVTILDNAMIGEGKATIYMKDFGFDPPSIVGQTIVSDPVELTIKGVAYLVEG